LEKDIGTIIDKKGSLSVVKVALSDFCTSCSSKGGCAAFGTGSGIMEARDRFDTHIGDVVRITCKPSHKITAAIITFILPIVFLIAGYVIGMALVPEGTEVSEKYGIIGSFAGLVLSFGLLKIIDLYLKNKKKYFPEIVKVLEKSNQDKKSDTMAIDPICKMKVNEQGAQYKTTYKGNTYYFCCKHCLSTFNKNPENYNTS